VPKNNREYWLNKINRNVSRDKLVTRMLRVKGWKVVRIWEDAIAKPSTVARLRKAIG
jgi:DNA mismatch endonuclease (patch repair protein)